MGKLFKKIVVLAQSVFTLHILLIWPIRAALSDNDYTHMIKGRLCNKMEFPWDDENFISFHVKPKMMVCFLSGWYAVFSCYLTISAWEHRAKYSIPRR